jgi:hypothetical protein
LELVIVPETWLVAEEEAGGGGRRKGRRKKEEEGGRREERGRRKRMRKRDTFRITRGQDRGDLGIGRHIGEGQHLDQVEGKLEGIPRDQEGVGKARDADPLEGAEERELREPTCRSGI